jgi:predicted subunit of tRNA(5-methylaminomethyl-2-thiouridylate) methyltransferase
MTADPHVQAVEQGVVPVLLRRRVHYVAPAHGVGEDLLDELVRNYFLPLYSRGGQRC